MELVARQGMKRKHVKRTTGCHTCRERKVRCDEMRPRCQNCVKYGRTHNVQCTYDAVGAAAEPPRQHSLLESFLNGSPTMKLPITYLDQTLDITTREHFLIHHTITISHEMQHCQMTDVNLGSKLYVRAIQHANEMPLLRDCICGAAIQHLYELSKSVQMLCEKYLYREKVLVGLRQHLASGDKLNCGAILVACMMLSWDAYDSEEFFRSIQGLFLVLSNEDANNEQSDLTKLFLPLVGDQQISRWRQNQSELLSSAMQSLKKLAQLVREKPLLLRAARELQNHLVNMLPLQNRRLPEPAQLKALYPVRSWMPWIPTFLEHVREHKQFIAPSLANYEMVKMAQALVLPDIRHSIGLRERALAIQSASDQLGSGFISCNVHTSSVMQGPLLMARAFMMSSEAEPLVDR
ncbi:hypothetical protein KCU81_g6085, partial [Aureobasidium melanogenum]|uniref:Zn(2)-C6 fungal-type domain-containing protein n=1 Tax=Aureobasidium melanogenum (strain CBS 110374) TaxID=1043003 RepID=A0A074VWP0_AURM1